MHKRIYQLSTSPIEKDEFITIEDISYAPFNFVGEIADYVDDIPEAQSSSAYVELYRSLAHANNIKPFSVNMTKLSGAPEVIMFGEGFREAYFTEKFKRFRDVLDRLSGVDLDGFSNNIHAGVPFLIFRLNNTYNEKYGHYIWIDDDLLTLDEFARSCELNTPYYFGNVLDYHW